MGPHSYSKVAHVKRCLALFRVRGFFSDLLGSDRNTKFEFE